MTCEYDYENPVKRGRAYFTCPKCGADASFEAFYLEKQIKAHMTNKETPTAKKLDLFLLKYLVALEDGDPRRMEDLSEDFLKEINREKLEIIEKFKKDYKVKTGCSYEPYEIHKPVSNNL